MTDEVAAIGSIIWHISHADEGTISVTGADIIAKALLAAGYTLQKPRRVLHATGFMRTPDEHNQMPISSVRITSYEGNVADVANDVVTVIRQQGHEVKTWRTWSLDGEPVQLDALCYVKGAEDHPLWHVFMYEDTPWPRTLPEPSD